MLWAHLLSMAAEAAVHEDTCTATQGTPRGDSAQDVGLRTAVTSSTITLGHTQLQLVADWCSTPHALRGYPEIITQAFTSISRCCGCQKQPACTSDSTERAFYLRCGTLALLR